MGHFLNLVSETKTYSTNIYYIMRHNNSSLIPQEAGEGLAERLGVKYMESSAKTNENVSESFQVLVIN